MKYYSDTDTEKTLAWLKNEIDHFMGLNKAEISIERTLTTKLGQRTYTVKLKKMMDITERYTGTVVTFNDITDRLEFDRQLREQNEKSLSICFMDSIMVSAIESISILNTIGIKHINFVPVYPGMAEVPDLKYAITPAQLEYVPKGVENVTDIGWRVIDTTTMLDIVTKLGIMNKAINNAIAMRQKEIISLNLGLQYMFENSNMVLEMTNEGVIYTDDHLNIKDYNGSMIKIIQMSKYIGQNIIGTIIPESFAEIFTQKEEVEKYSLKHPLFNKTFEVSKKAFIVNGKSHGYIFLIEDETEVKSLEFRLKGQSISSGYVTKYGFDDILGKSDVIMKCKEKAKKMATSDNVVLLIGESGTGKELFAQSVHNVSKRSKMPFLAINCSALYPQLLESELPMSVQAKFLRILQEKELIRVGGSEIISVDVRVIAATNKKLTKLIEEKKFRKDLYYRLSIYFISSRPFYKGFKCRRQINES